MDCRVLVLKSTTKGTVGSHGCIGFFDCSNLQFCDARAYYRRLVSRGSRGGQSFKSAHKNSKHQSQWDTSAREPWSSGISQQ